MLGVGRAPPEPWQPASSRQSVSRAAAGRYPGKAARLPSSLPARGEGREGTSSSRSEPPVHDRLLLRVLVEGLQAVLLAEAGLLGAPEGQLVVGDLERVDPGVAGFQL